MKYIKDIKAILSEIGMAFFSARVHEVNRFFLPATKKKRNREKKKKTGKERKTKEIWSKKRSLKDTENYSQNTSLTNSVCFDHHDPLRFLSSARSSLVI